jgi:hypothetical protein
MLRTTTRSVPAIVFMLSFGAAAAHAQDVPRNTKPFRLFKVLLSSPLSTDRCRSTFLVGRCSSRRHGSSGLHGKLSDNPSISASRS